MYQPFATTGCHRQVRYKIVGNSVAIKKKKKKKGGGRIRLPLYNGGQNLDTVPATLYSESS